MLRIITLLLAISAFAGIGTTPPPFGDGPEPSPVQHTAGDNLDPAERMLVDFARKRFARAGLELPETLKIRFPLDEGECHGFGGLYVRSRVEVRICRPSDTTMIHELAHAWIETTLNEDQREDFMALRGLETWTGGQEWSDRGAEQAAEILTWGLMDRDITFRWLEVGPDGRAVETFRLLKIDQSTHDELRDAFRLLTGHDPADRTQRASTAVVASSPEARRHTQTTEPNVGGLRRGGEIVSPEAMRRA